MLDILPQNLSFIKNILFLKNINGLQFNAVSFLGFWILLKVITIDYTFDFDIGKVRMTSLNPVVISSHDQHTAKSHVSKDSRHTSIVII